MADRAYAELEQSLAPDGIRCQFQTQGQFVVSRQVGPIWPDRGNSFWVTHAGGNWNLFTWAPCGYRLADSGRVAELCRTFMASGDSAQFMVPEVIVKEFGLTELSDEEAEAIYKAMSAE